MHVFYVKRPMAQCGLYRQLLCNIGAERLPRSVLPAQKGVGNQIHHDLRVRSPYVNGYISKTKTLITNKCTKRVLSSTVTHFYMFRPFWVIFRENFFVNSLRSRPAGRDRREFTPPKKNAVHSQQHILTQL
jgi:hypothetical protein